MKYSKIIKIDNKLIRYNYTENELEWVEKINHDRYEIIYSSGLSQEEWDENRKYWLSRFNEEIEQELEYMLDYSQYIEEFCM